MEYIEAGKIRVLSGQFQKARLDYQREPLRARLGRIANVLASGNLVVTGENAVERDEATELLHPYGTLTVANMFAAAHEWPPIPEEPRLTRGMALLGLPSGDIDRLSAAFNKGELPSDVVDPIVEQQEAIQGLHPDKYPFNDTAYDLIQGGLSQPGIDAEKIWQGVEKNLIERGRPDLALMYGYGSPAENITGILAHFALTKHNIRELASANSEVHF